MILTSAKYGTPTHWKQLDNKALISTVVFPLTVDVRSTVCPTEAWRFMASTDHKGYRGDGVMDFIHRPKSKILKY
jgi:hypothetical protein